MQAALLSERTANYKEWRVSWRKAAYEDELTDPKKVRPRLKRKYEAFHDLAPGLGTVPRRSSKEDPQKQAEKRNALAQTLRAAEGKLFPEAKLRAGRKAALRVRGA